MLSLYHTFSSGKTHFPGSFFFTGLMVVTIFSIPLHSKVSLKKMAEGLDSWRFGTYNN
jgi:hypothetical protein